MSGRQDTGTRGTGRQGAAGAEDRPGPPTAAAPREGGVAAPATTGPRGVRPTGSGRAGRPGPVLPTQAGHPLSAPVPAVAERTVAAPPAPLVPPAPAVPSLPTQRGAGTEPRTGAGPATSRAPRRSVSPVTALLTAAVVLLAAGGGWSLQQERAARADARLAAQQRVSAVALGVLPELTAPRTAGAVVGAATAADRRALTVAASRSAVDAATASLAASPQAGDAPRAALETAIGAATSGLDAPAVSLRTLRDTAAALEAPRKAVVDAQAAWQAQEEARLAAEAQARAAAEQARASAPRRAPGAARTTAPAAGAPSSSGLPTAGSEASAGAVGEALNAHRAANGLGALRIVRSGARVEHAMQMAATDSIWHSGTRAGSPKARPEIVGRVSPGNATRMIVAYANSSGHNAQMLGSYSTAYVGAVSHGGWLYTSITFS